MVKKDKPSNSLLNRLKNHSYITDAEILGESTIWGERDFIETDIPIFNIAFSGEVRGGFSTGLTVIAGESKTFKTLLSLYCLKAYLAKYPEAIGVIYDSEFGITPEYLRSLDIDVNKILHVPVENLEQLIFDIRKKLEEIKKGDKIFFLYDSLGNTASIKETTDALDEKQVKDMSRPATIKSLFRIVTPHLAKKDIPFFVVNHTYKSQGFFPTDVVAGGSGVAYSSNQIFVITKSQEKEASKEKTVSGKDKAIESLAGYNFTINIFKSRYVKEKSKFEFTVLFDRGIAKWSGIETLATKGGFLTSPEKGKLQLVDPDTGEVDENKIAKTKHINLNNDFWQEIVYSEKFNSYIKNAYALGQIKLAGGNTDSNENQEDDR
jgi:hypothetical protein